MNNILNYFLLSTDLRAGEFPSFKTFLSSRDSMEVKTIRNNVMMVVVFY